VQTNGIQLVRHGKNQVVVFNRQGALNQFLDPECLPGSLASGTVPVSTTVVRVTDGSAVFTSFLVATKSSRTAVSDFPQDFQLQGSNPCLS